MNRCYLLHGTTVTKGITESKKLSKTPEVPKLFQPPTMKEKNERHIQNARNFTHTNF